jgi:hypothetical protein
MEPEPPAPAGQPPNAPERWAARDAVLRTQLLLSRELGPPEEGEPRCACGGTWRYVLLAHPAQPIWRCLHDGQLHRGVTAIAEDDQPRAAPRRQ